MFPKQKAQGDHLSLGKFDDFSLTHICLFFSLLLCSFFWPTSIPTCDFISVFFHSPFDRHLGVSSLGSL